MKVRITYAAPNQYPNPDPYYQMEYESIKQAAAHCGRGPRIISRALKTGSEENSALGKIVLVEAINGKTEGVGSEVREYPYFVKENSSLGALEVRGGGGWIQQALGKITSAVYRILSKFS